MKILRKGKSKKELNMKNHRKAIKKIMKNLVDRDNPLNEFHCSECDCDFKFSSCEIRSDVSGVSLFGFKYKDLLFYDEIECPNCGHIFTLDTTGITEDAHFEAKILKLKDLTETQYEFYKIKAEDIYLSNLKSERWLYKNDYKELKKIIKMERKTK